MAARAIWKGVLCLASQRVPVKLYSAIEDRSIHFRLLHAKDHAPVKQAMVDPDTDSVVPREDIRRGYTTAEGDIVLVHKKDLEEIEPAPSRDIMIEYFVPPGEIAYRHYLRPYLLGPDGDEPAYVSFLKALKESGQEGFVRWVMRKKEYIGALRVFKGYPMLITLKYQEQVVDLDAVKAPKGKSLDDRELSMAEQLVDMLAEDFDPAAYQDEYREQVRKLIDTKAAGGKVKTFRPKRKRVTDDLSKALSASLKQEKKHG